MVFFQENEPASLYSGKIFTSWEICEDFLKIWTEEQGFRIIKDRVCCEEEFVWQRIFLCKYNRLYNSNSNKDTSTKKIWCPFLINAFYPKANNPETSIIINKINN